MFKKLKKKIEEGEEGGIDKIAFSPRKFPGSVVRSLPADAAGSPEAELGSQPSMGQAVNGSTGTDTGNSELEAQAIGSLLYGKNTEVFGEGRGFDLLPASIPNHLQSSMKSDSPYALLLARIEELEQEQARLHEKLEESEELRLQQLQELRSRCDGLESEVTEQKLQVVELELEKAEVQEQLEEDLKKLREQTARVELEKSQERSVAEKQVAELEQQLLEKEKLLKEGGSRAAELEEKIQRLESKLEVYSHLSENEVILRLQNEVIDLEQRMKSRNLEIEIIRTSMAVQARENDDEREAALDRHEALEAKCKELSEQLSEKKVDIRELIRDLNKERALVANRDEELAKLQSQLEEKTTSYLELETQLEETSRSHEETLESALKEKDAVIAELSSALEFLKRELAELQSSREAEEVSTPHQSETPAPVETPSTDSHPEEISSPAVLPVETQNECSVTDSLGGEEREQVLEQDQEPATMRSHELEEELQYFRREQLRLQEEVADKNKIIKFQQQKIIDMRKALSRELKTQTSVENNAVARQQRKEKSPSPALRIAIASDVNFQYLKHVVIKFVCSREDEALQLVRAMSTLLEFTPQEEQHVKDYLEYRMSWFGTLPPPLYAPSKSYS